MTDIDADTVARDLLAHAMRGAVRLLGADGARELLLRIARAVTAEDRLRERLDAIYSPKRAEEWLDEPHQALNTTPRQMIARGRADRVEKLILALESDYEVRT